MPRLGVNIDHVATLRQARGGREPDPVWAAVLAELGGADGITIHLREDRRHIQDRDLRLLRETVQVRLNLELAVEPAIVAHRPGGPARPGDVRPRAPRGADDRRGPRRGRATSSGSARPLARCRDAGIDVALFIDPDPRQVEAAVELGVAAVELHTGRYADAPEGPDRDRELEPCSRPRPPPLVAAGLELHAGHGLNYRNVAPVARLDRMAELNIGHSIVSRAVFVGLTQAVREMKDMHRSGRGPSIRLTHRRGRSGSPEPYACRYHGRQRDCSHPHPARRDRRRATRRSYFANFRSSGPNSASLSERTTIRFVIIQPMVL